MKTAILVVDDDADIRLTLKEVLEDEEYRVTLAANGQEALDRLDVAVPDLILLDVMMPVMNAAKFREAQLKEPRWAKIPTVLITADARAGEVARDLKATGLIRKPIGLTELLKVVRSYTTPVGGGSPR